MNPNNQIAPPHSVTIDTVIFDVGWVLVHLNFEPLLQYIASSGQQLGINDILTAIDLQAHERGEIGGLVLFDNFLRLMPTLERQRLEAHWVDMFIPQQAMFDLARRLATRYRVHLLSNVGEVHWAHLNERYALNQIGDGALPSFEAGVMKPHADIYRQAEQRFGLTPARTVFIDDLEPNVAAARTRGWHAIQHVSASDTMQALKQLGVKWE